jgi:hypothetical protein
MQNLRLVVVYPVVGDFKNNYKRCHVYNVLDEYFKQPPKYELYHYIVLDMQVVTRPNYGVVAWKY